MSGSDLTFNIAKGKLAYYAGLPGASDALGAVLLSSTGLVSDDTLIDYDDLAALIAGASAEADSATNYVRKALSSVTVTVDDTNNRVDLDSADITWTALGGAANVTVAKLLICYWPTLGTGTYLNTGGSADNAIIPLTCHSFDVTTDGTDLTATVTNFARAS